MVTLVMCHLYLMPLGLLIISNLDGALTCQTGTLEQCVSLPFVPGYGRAAEGYDVVKLERKGAYVLDVHNYLSPTNSCRICANPLMDGQLQKLPYYMADWQSHSHCKREIQTSAFSSVSSAVGSASSVITNDWAAGLGLGKIVGLLTAGTRSKVHSFLASSSFQSEQSSVNVNQFSCTHYRFRVSNRYPLSGEFQRDIKSLPRQYTRCTNEPYRRFIDIYGTHYIRLVDLGGRMTKVTSIRTCLAILNSVTASQVEQCMSNGIMVGLGFAELAHNMDEACINLVNNHYPMTNDNDYFLKRMTEKVGGNGWSGEFSLTTEDSDGFTKWKDSLKTLPDILSFSLSPLHELVANAKIRSNLQTAISEYVLENGIQLNDTEICTPKPNLSPDCCPLPLPAPPAGWGHHKVVLVSSVCVSVFVFVCLCVGVGVFIRRAIRRAKREAARNRSIEECNSMM